MRDPAVRLVLLPRYTALYGAMTFYTPPINIRAFEKAILTVWKSNGIGGTPADVNFTFDQSVDLDIWNASGSFSPASANSEEVFEPDLLVEWGRLSATVSGASPGITVWAVGTFIPRARPG